MTLPKPYFQDELTTLYCGDCLDILPELSGITGCLTDPPYGLEFMGREWDSLGRKQALRGATSGLPIGLGSGRGTSPTAGRPGLDLSLEAQNAMQEWHLQWAKALLSCCLPGAPLLAFGGTRTHHRLWCAIEDAGWELRDTLTWLYGSGFPKSLDIAKTIDKAARGVPQGSSDPTSPAHGKYKGGCSGESPQGRGFGAGPGAFMKEQMESAERRELIPEAQLWQGYGTALKPAFEPICLAMKPNDGTFAHNALTHGIAGLNIDGGRIGTDTQRGERYNGKPSLGGQSRGIYSDFPHETSWQVPQGRWPANLILSHTPDCKCVGTKKVKNRSGSVSGNEPSKPALNTYGEYDRKGFDTHKDCEGNETVESWECSLDCPVRMLDEQSGETTSSSLGGRQRTGTGGQGIFGGGNNSEANRHQDSGGSSRFFKCCEPDATCPLCTLTFTPRHVTMTSRGDECSNTNVPNVERILTTIQATIANTVPLLAHVKLIERIAQSVSSVANLCNSCGIVIAVALVGIKTSAFNQQELGVILGYTRQSTNSILIQNLVLCAAKWESTDTIPTTEDLLKLFGSANHATTNYTQGTAKSEQSRFYYTSKADGAERDSLCDDLFWARDKASSIGYRPIPYSEWKALPANARAQGNIHPTVKPIALLKYLLTLIKMPEKNLIIDPFVGSGSTLVAARELGIPCIGIEKEEYYCFIAANRIQQGMMSL